MMDYPDFVSNVQTAYSNLYQNPASAMQPIIDSVSKMIRGTTAPSQHKHGCHCHEHDCACSCCIRCADMVEYARCGEVRRIPITFDNDSRRERDVTLQVGAFATESGQDVGWQAAVSETSFKLPPCGEKTVILTVNVDCGRLGTPQTPGKDQQQAAGVDSCKVVYATLRAESCAIRPLVIAVAVLPEFCGTHHTSCSCGCCN